MKMGRTPDFSQWQYHWQTILLEKWLGVTRRGTYQAASEDSRWVYEPVSDLWPYIDPASNSSDGWSSNEGRKYQENLEDQEQEELILVPKINPRRIIRGDQIALIQLKSDIEISKGKIFSLSTGL